MEELCSVLPSRHLVGSSLDCRANDPPRLVLGNQLNEATTGAGERARWEVLWVSKGKIHRKDCEHDLTEAIRVYNLVKGKRPGATLRCKNMGHPPPEYLLPRQVKYKAREELPRPKIIRRGGKRYRQTHEVITKVGLLVPMKKKNAAGIWWCPYCRELRRFAKRKTVKVDAGNGQMIKIGSPGMYCPLCGTSHRDHNVRKWNPIAIKIFYEMEAEHHRAPARTKQSRRAARRRRKRANGE